MSSSELMSNDNTSRRDLYRDVTETIIRQLEAGTFPWQQPWKSKGGNRILTIPRNQSTGKFYRGINILLLWAMALEMNYETNDWGSFKQWTQKGEHVRRGEKGSLVVYYDTFEKEVEGETKKIPFLKSSIVFNRCQLASFVPENEGAKEPEPIVGRISAVEEFVAATGASIEHGEDKACYIPSADKICMPHPEAFKEVDGCTASEHYYSTLNHELVHWTGGPKRLDRTKGKRFGDNAYATEELVAELGAAFLSASFGLNTVDKGSHANYLSHWIDVLKKDKFCIFVAASEATKAVDYLNQLQPA